MEKIIRIIERQRSETFTQQFQFSTYDVIFDKAFRELHPEAAELMEYLEGRFREGLPARPTSPSQMPQLIIETKQVFGHPFCQLAFDSQYQGQGNKQHLTVQNFFMANCAECLAFEVPVFDDEASGCIDILTIQFNPFIVGVHDFKPDAVKEKKAPGQTFRYAKMLIEGAKLNPENVVAGYFDAVHYFEVLLRNHL